MATRRAFQRNLRDADKLANYAGATGASGAGTATSAGIDLNSLTAQGERPQGLELVLVVPAQSTSQLPDAATLTHTIEASDNSDFSGTPDVLGTYVQTGAGGAGDVAAELRVGVASNTKRYVRAKSVGNHVNTTAPVTYAFALVI